MAISVVSDWESGQGTKGIPDVLESDRICFRTSSSSLGTNFSLQIHSFGVKVQPDMWTGKWNFLVCPDETQPTCCWSFLLIRDWNQWILFVPLITFVINALLGRHAQWAMLGVTGCVIWCVWSGTLSEAWLRVIPVPAWYHPSLDSCYGRLMLAAVCTIKWNARADRVAEWYCR